MDAVGVVEDGDGKVHDQQRHRNREQPVGEGQGPVELDAVAVVGPRRRYFFLFFLHFFALVAPVFFLAFLHFFFLGVVGAGLGVVGGLVTV